MVLRVLAVTAAIAAASISDAQLLLLPSDTPLVVPDGGAGNATSWVTTDVNATTTAVQLAVAITFSDPANSGAMLYLVGPNTVPPSGFCYLGCAAGGNVYMVIDDTAPQSCVALGCCSAGCGTASNPVSCSSFDSLEDFFAGEPADAAPWGLRVGDGPPTAGTVIQDWTLHLEIEGGVFFDGFESGTVLRWSPHKLTESQSRLSVD